LSTVHRRASFESCANSGPAITAITMPVHTFCSPEFVCASAQPAMPVNA